MARAIIDQLVHDEDGSRGDLTPMIDVVFLLLIFFMCMKFKSYENRLDADLPGDSGLSPNPVEPLQQLRIRLHLLPGRTDCVQILPEPLHSPFRPIGWTGDTAGMMHQLEEQIRAGYRLVGDRVELAPDPRVPFEYVALTLDAVHKAQDHVPADERKSITFAAAAPDGH